jgi:hypothetical protein
LEVLRVGGEDLNALLLVIGWLTVLDKNANTEEPTTICLIYSPPTLQPSDPLFQLQNLVLWARSEIYGYAEGGSYLNPKHEIRNPKQYLMFQIRMIKTRPWRYKFMHYV